MSCIDHRRFIADGYARRIIVAYADSYVFLGVCHCHVMEHCDDIRPTSKVYLKD